MIDLIVGVDYDMRSILRKLVDMQFDRNDATLGRGKFRVRGDTIEVHPSYEETVLRIEMFGDTVDRLTVDRPDHRRDAARRCSRTQVFPATHYVAGDERMAPGGDRHRGRAAGAAGLVRGRGQAARGPAAADAHPVRPRDDGQEVGYCNGIENYSMHIDGRTPGEPPFTLLDYFPDDFLLVIDESHQAVPQLHGQYEGDRSRKDMLVEHGFRLPSARDNRPLRSRRCSSGSTSASSCRRRRAPTSCASTDQVVEQIVRPTGLVDPEVIVRPTKGQIDDLIENVNDRVTKGDRVLVTTLTKKMAEDLTDYLLEQGLRVRYLHSNIDTIQRIEILRALRLGEFDVLVGINLLREGLDLPEVSLVAILDADKEGFLRSRDVADPDDRPRRPQRRRPGRDVRRQDHRLDGAGDRHSPSAGGSRSSPTTPSTASTRRPSARRSATSSRCSARTTPSPVPGKDRRRQRERDKVQRELKTLPQQELARLIQTLEEEMHEAAAELQVRVRGPPPRRGQRPAPRAPRRRLSTAWTYTCTSDRCSFRVTIPPMWFLGSLED